MDEGSLQHLLQSSINIITPPAAVPSSAMAVGYGWSRILNAPEPPPPHSVVAGKEVQVFKIKNLVFGLKIQSLFIGGSNTNLFIY